MTGVKRRKAPDPMWPPLAKCQPGQKRRLKMGEDTPKTGLKAHVVGLIRVLALDGYHTAFSLRSMTGFPDFVIWGPGGAIYRELKGDGYEPTPEQAVVLQSLRDAGQDAGWWNPDDWYSGRIERELRALRHPPRPTGTLPPLDLRVSRTDAWALVGTEVEVARGRIGVEPTYGAVLVELGALRDRLQGMVRFAIDTAAETGYQLGRDERYLEPTPGSLVSPLRCPTCGSPQPSMHPEVAGGGVAALCPDLYHRASAAGGGS